MRILLNKPDGSITKYAIAKMAECSAPWVIEFLRNLEGKHLVEKTKILDFEKLVDYYISIMQKIKHFDYFVQNPLEFLKSSGLKYAITTYAGENYFTHQLFPTRYDVYIDEKDIDTWKNLIMANGLLGGGNLRLLVSYDLKIIEDSTKIKGISVVSKSVLLIDLRAEGGVCMESYHLMVSENV